MIEYRAVLVCCQDPCPYCGGPARRQISPTGRAYQSRADAEHYGARAKRMVFAIEDDEHMVKIECRRVGEWHEPASITHRHASPQAWKRLREAMGPGEAKDLAKDISQVTGADPEAIWAALVAEPWDERVQA